MNYNNQQTNVARGFKPELEKWFLDLPRATRINKKFPSPGKLSPNKWDSWVSTYVLASHFSVPSCLGPEAQSEKSVETCTTQYFLISI